MHRGSAALGCVHEQTFICEIHHVSDDRVGAGFLSISLFCYSRLQEATFACLESRVTVKYEI